jgi:hypothetical protein
LAWLAGENIKSGRAHLAGVPERAAEREREQQARQAGAEERLRIAREMHDVVAHAMSIIAVRSGVAGVVIDIRSEEARGLRIIELVTTTAQDCDPGSRGRACSADRALSSTISIFLPASELRYRAARSSSSAGMSWSGTPSARRSPASASAAGIGRSGS